ncbi:MAG: hypothetical protein IVW55_04250 [Chloroflexi bacterium]|nr:hypothetical protein [Chloroflexota bacterium]
MDTETQLAFEGTKQEQEIAARTFELMKRKGMLFGANAPIKMSLDAILKALTREGGPMAGQDASALARKVESALGKNQAVFSRDDNGDFVTTKAGHAYHPQESKNTHTFRQRLNTEATALDTDAAKEYASSLVNRVATRAERSALMDTIIDIAPALAPQRPLFTPPALRSTTEIPTLIPQHLIPQPVIEEKEEPEEAEAPTPQHLPESAPAAHVEVAPAVPLAVTLDHAAPPAPAPASPPQIAKRPEPAEIEPARVNPAAPQTQVTQPAPAEQAPVKVPAPTAVVSSAPATPPAQVQAPAPKPAPAKPAPVQTPPEPAVTGPVEVRIPSVDGAVTVNLSEPLDDIMSNPAVVDALTTMIGIAVEHDSRLIHFGSEMFPEEALDRFSKGDFRRIREYLEEPETGGVASDRDIMADVLNRRPENPDYERMRFALSYRMLKEKKDFEFVGINSDRLWIIANSSPVAPPLRKPAEIGQDYRYLEDTAIVSVEEEDEPDSTPGPLDYALTYYEYENGVLPYDRRAKRLFQGPVFEDQRASMIRFEMPQLYVSLLAELRYPTGNRGGFIMGLGDLFAEYMIPGARFRIVPTDRGEDVFEIHFNRPAEREDNLLQLDERKGRYLFRPVSYSVEADPAMLLSQERFGKLQNQKKLDDLERKRPETIITNAFEAVGEENDGKLWAIFDDIYPVVNIERPISRSWLKTMLSGAYPYFYPDENAAGAYFYDSARKPS